MRKILLLLCLFNPFLQSLVGQQIPHQAPTSTQAFATKVSLDLGSVTVWLGMQETDALSAFQLAGYRVMRKPSEQMIFIVGNSTTYSVAFRDGSLAYADREWPSSASDELGAVLKALTALASHGATSCSIVDNPLNQPDMSAIRVLIDCGARSVLLAKGKYGQTDDNKFVTISEQIGER